MSKQTLDELFSKRPHKQRFTMARVIPTQLKMLIRSDPLYVVRYAFDDNGNLLKFTQPKDQIDDLLRSLGYGKLRGVGFTRKDKRTSKRQRKMTQASRRKNRK